MKTYEGNPHTGKIIVRESFDDINPRMIEALNNLSWESAVDPFKYYVWSLTEHNYMHAIEILSDYGYYPSIRDGG